jgi:hypothetical protein
MKLLLAVMFFLMMAFVLGWGILLAVRGQPSLLIAAAAGYALTLGLVGCLPKKSHH